MVNFTFNILDRLSITGRIYRAIADWVNSHLLAPDLFDPLFISDAFNAIDSFWLRHRSTDWYSESEVRIVVGMILESLKDNHLSADEVRALSNYIMRRWKPEVAEAKPVVEELLEKVEEPAEKAVEVFRIRSESIPSIEKYVEQASGILAKGQSVLSIFR